MNSTGFLGYVVGGLIVGTPLCILTGVSIWLQWKSLQRHVTKETARQDQKIQQMLDAQTRQLRYDDD